MSSRSSAPLQIDKGRGLPRLFSIADVAARLDVSQKTVRRMIDRGELPIHRIGKLIRISETDLTAVIARSRSS